jgi:hypothetical protein
MWDVRYESTAVDVHCWGEMISGTRWQEYSE